MLRSARTMVVFVLAGCALLGPAAAAGSGSVRAARRRPLRAHGQLLHLVRPRHGHFNASQSNNWFGYNQGALSSGQSLFHSIGASWIVPRASQHSKGQAEASSDWIGIGGGCVNSGCAVSDETLIQTGTEQDVSSNGKASYSAWWEIIPDPSTTIRMTIRPGDRIHATIAEGPANSELWRITIRDLTRRESHTISTAYPSTHDTAEWIEETPLEIGTDAGLASLPNLSLPRFDLATVNGHAAHLESSQEIDLTNSAGKVIGVPSGPNRAHNGFNACTWARRCPSPRRT